MRVEGIGDSGREIVVRRRGAFGHIEIRPVEIAAKLLQQCLDALLRGGVVDEPRLEVGKQLGEFVDGHLVLRGLWIQRPERLGDQLTGELDERQRRGSRGVHEQLTFVELLAPRLVVHWAVRIDCVHVASQMALNLVPTTGA